jgi:hypothetical protein
MFSRVLKICSIGMTVSTQLYGQYIKPQIPRLDYEYKSASALALHPISTPLLRVTPMFLSIRAR